MRCQRHDLALGPDGMCVLCRREEQPRRIGRPIVVAALVAVGVAVLGLAVNGQMVQGMIARGGAVPAAAAGARTPRREGALATTNSAGRTGAFYLPSEYALTPLPLLVAIHGTGGSGRGMVALFRAEAEHERFIVVAPDSRIAPNGEPSWQVPDRPGDTTDDREHILGCVDEVLAMPGVRIDTSRTLIAGHSGGASTAPYVASVDDLYEAFAVLHGGIFVGGLGPRRPRGWFSTGSVDALRPPQAVREAADQLKAVGFQDVVYREFANGHEVSAEEILAVVGWWLGGRRD